MSIVCFVPVDVLVFAFAFLHNLHAFLLLNLGSAVFQYFFAVFFPVFIHAVALVAVATNARRTQELSA